MIGERDRAELTIHKDSWGFIASEQDEGVRGGKLLRNFKCRGFLLNWPNRVLAKGMP